MYETVLKFWFEEARPEQWWKKDESFDRTIVERFAQHVQEFAVVFRL